MPTRPLVILVFVATAVLSWSTRVRAQPIRTYSLDYQAPSSCPAASELVAQIERRSRLARRVVGPARFRLHVDLARRPDHTEAVLDLAEGGAKTRRHVRGQSCAQVVSALALMAAVAMDPNAETGPLPRRPARVFAPRRSKRARARPNSTRRQWRGQAGFLAGATGGVAPDITAFYGPWFGVRPPGRGIWRPELRLAVLLARASTVTASGGASFTWTAARAQVCLPHPQLAVGLHASACALIDAGRVQGRGYETKNPRTQNAPWIALGAQGELDATIHRTLLISLEVGGVAPIIHDRFLFLPSQPVHRIPPLAGFAALSVGVAW